MISPVNLLPILTGQIRLEPVIGQWKAKVRWEVLERKEERGWKMEEEEEEEEEEANMEQNHMASSKESHSWEQVSILIDLPILGI